MLQAADMINLGFLSDSEQELILEVLRRDEELRQVEEHRVRKLKTELLDVKRKGAKRSNGTYSQHSCGRCLEPLSRLAVFSSQCKMCNHHVCRNCRTVCPNGSWLCSVCAKEFKNLGSTASRESYESKEDVSSKSTCSDTESAENTSNKTETESGRVTPDLSRKETHSGQSSPTGSIVSSQTVSVKSDTVSVHSTNSVANTDPEGKLVIQSPEFDVDRLFKKSVRRVPKPAGYVSTLDLRDEMDTSTASMGNRSHSVPGIDVQDEEEEEDIDSLVSFHRRTMASSSSNLHSSKSTLGSLMSIYSEAGDYDSVEVSGDIVFSVSYDENTQSLQVFIKECHGLAYGDASRQISNPYVKCYLLPDKSRQSKRKTTNKRNTINPIYKETLKYSISRSQLFTRSVLISVWHYGRLSRNTFLGEVEIPMDCRDLDSPEEERVALMGKAASVVTASAFAQYKGELVISLKYITPKKPTAEKIKGKKAVTVEGGELHVLIKEAKNLMAMKTGDTSDSFVKGLVITCRLAAFPYKRPSFEANCVRVSAGKNHKEEDSSCEEEPEPFVQPHVCVQGADPGAAEGDVSGAHCVGQRGHVEQRIPGRSAPQLWQGIDCVICTASGTVKIGKEEVEMDSVGEEVSLWQKMMQYPDSWAEGTLPLRSTMGKGKGK
ncbi:hypothetical protein PAMP_023221 [Pampus punctatissimus]